jgi:ATP-dependent helicase HrpA
MTDSSSPALPATNAAPPIHYPPDLPITTHRAAIADALRQHQVVIICGDTGSGKTTQIPKIALEMGRGRQARIGCTQPRRLAAVTVATRVAEEFGQLPGQFIGYHHRFEQRLCAASRIVFKTDGILLAETRRDRLLRAYDTLIIDEAHERSLNIDFLLGILQGILPRRPDLKLIISSATLDGERFADFFGGAPVLRIPGRLHPIDLRYRPPEEDDADLPRLIANAVDELDGEAAGDILVFLPGERDIREAADTLQGRHLPNTEIIPLLASLPAGEQQRAFRVSSNRRIVLATNVAETSVTIPGIRYVIDSGLARISRYHHRTRVQRLHIEPISQASANQRMGRCGRLGPGICIRLYAEEDFRKRDAYTDPEILRASLAGVILTMLDLRLGDIARFPFIDAPSPNMIKEGYRELLELGALAERPAAPPGAPAAPHLPPTLSPIGTRLAHLPVEPRLGRILLAAHEEKALRDALIVVAALECDDPRRRPIDKQTEADTCHARFLTPHSDFAALLQLWRWYDDQTRQSSQGIARRLCREHFLSFPRMKEWRDLRDQLERLCRELQLDPQSATGGDAGLHRALLTGLLGSIGQRDPETNDYRGPHGLRFALFPGSGLLKKRKHEQPQRPAASDRHPPPPRAAPLTWLMAGEMVETSRLYARQAASIDPSWIEPLARHLCKYSYHSPEWDAEKGFVRVRERVTLYGLVLVENRLRDYSRIAPAESRAIFIRHALVAGEFPRPPPFLANNFARLEALRLAEQKTRRHGQLLDEEAIVAFYDRRLPPDICNADALRRWARQAAALDVAALEFGPDDLPTADIATGYPDTITVAGQRLALTYNHNPGESDDGIVCTLPATLLESLRAWRAEWLVPGALPDKVHWMLSTLPGKTRRLLAPLDETVAMCLSRMSPGREPLATALARALGEARGIRIPPDTWREADAPNYLRVLFRVVNPEGQELGQGRDLDTLARLLTPATGAKTTAPQPATPTDRWQRDNLLCWDFADLPEQVDFGRAGWPIINYPALVDDGNRVSLRLFADPAAAHVNHEAGVVRLLLLALGRLGKMLTHPGVWPRSVQALLREAEITEAQLSEEITRAAIAHTCLDGLPAVRDAATFQQRLEGCQATLSPAQTELTRRIRAILEETAALQTAMRQSTPPAPPATRNELASQLAWLIFPGFVTAVPWETLTNYPRYLEAIRIRLERARLNPAGDARKQAEFAPHWQRYETFTELEQKPVHDRAALQEYRWLTEEFRISLFAQELRTALPVSAKRLDTLWAKAMGT